MRDTVLVGVAVTIVAALLIGTSGAVVITDPTNPLVMLFGIWHVCLFLGSFLGYLGAITYMMVR